MESQLGEGLGSAAAFLVQEPAWTPPSVVAASKVVALRERAPGESEESYQAYRRTRRAQQKAINEEQRPPRDRTGRKRPAQDAHSARKLARRSTCGDPSATRSTWSLPRVPRRLISCPTCRAHRLQP